MGWGRRLGWFNSAVQTVWFWGAVALSLVGGSVTYLAWVTDAFHTWAPLSYGVVFWIVVVVVANFIPSLVKFLPEPWHTRLAQRAVAVAKEIQIARLELDDDLMNAALRKTYALSLSFQRHGIAVPQFSGPDPRPVIQAFEHHFGVVGELLASGHIRDAKETAESLAAPYRRHSHGA